MISRRLLTRQSAQFYDARSGHGLRGGPYDVHPFGARLLINPFQIDEPDGLLFLDRHDDGSVVNPAKRSESVF